MWPRVIFTAVVSLVYAGAIAYFSPQATLAAGQAAGRQFANSDQAYLQTSYLFSSLSFANAIWTLLFLLCLGLIWIPPLLRKAKAEGLIALALLVLLGLNQPVEAYYDQKDFTEPYTILPNESAFWIPDVGDNKANQAQLQTEEFLNANKVALKRFIVPHKKLSGTGSFWDYYVPDGRLIIVDRTPYSREWVDAHDRGTSNTKQGINITAGVSIGVSVTEGNAAKFLYRFGVLPPRGVRTDPVVIFTSVYYGRPLNDVMDDVGRKKVQSLVCDELYNRTFFAANEEAIKIMETVTKKATDYFASVGITLDFIGWGDTFTFDSHIQEAVNRRYIASQDMAIAQMLQPFTATIQAVASAEALRLFAAKSNGALPTTIMGAPMDMSTLLTATWGINKAPIGPGVGKPANP